MQRPVMNPGFYQEDTRLPDPRWRLFRQALATSWRTMKLVGEILLFDPVAAAYRGRLKVDEGSIASRFLRGAMYRLAFLPIVVTLLCCVLVYAATHGQSMGSDQDPGTFGLYYDAVTCLSADGTPVDAWLVPLLDANLVLEQKEKLLRARHPAVVLVHDVGNRRQQMLPLVKPLHDAGYVVLVLALRGSDRPGGTAQTFGLREAMDVKAAVEMLRRRSFIQADAISLVGVGTGATAALLGGKGDPQLAALVLDHPVRGIDQIMQTRLGPRPSALGWLRPLCKWVFEIGYQLDADEIDLAHYTETLNRPAVLTLSDPLEPQSFSKAKQVERLLTFLSAHGRPKADARGAMLWR